MDKRTELNNALKEAMKNKDNVATSTIRLILAALKDRDIAARTAGQSGAVNDNDILAMMQSMIKQREDSAATYRQAERAELAEREEQEIAVIRRFMPQQLSESEVQAKIEALITELEVKDIKEMGKVMNELKTRYAGQLDMAKASGMVKEKLSA